MKKLKLSKEHLAELKASGLTNDTIQQSGLYTEFHSTNICKILNCNNPNLVNGSQALVIPFGYDGYYRLKLSHPRLRKGSADKTIKYESPWGSQQHPFFPPNTFDEIVKHETETEIFIVEGEKKALKLWQEFKTNEIDAFVIGLTGVYGWKEKQQEKLVEWLENIHWTNRVVYLCFDNDVHWNKNVSDARKRLAKILRNHGAQVKAIDIPITDPSQKLGVDDYIVKYGIVAFFNALSDSKVIDTKGIINVEIVSAAQIKTVAVEWLWNLYVPKGEITLLDGNPGLGKSQMIADLSARVSKGFAMPPIETSVQVTQPGNVMLLCAEDTLEKTVKPRLQVCNADMKRIFFMRSTGKPITFPHDIERFEQECIDLEIDFVVVDPIMSYIGREIDTHGDQSTREVMNRLKEFVENTNIAMICLRHLNKRSGDAAIFRGGGSIAFTAASRSTLVVGKHPSEEDVNVLASAKSNLERRPKSISYSIESVQTSHGSIGKLVWLDEIGLGADDIVDIDKTTKKVSNKVDLCVKQIEDTLKKNGPMLSVELQEVVTKLTGVSLSTFQHARKRSNIIRGRNPRERSLGRWWSKIPGSQFPWEHKKKTPPA